MAKILKNTTGSNIDLSELGLRVPASSQITIQSFDYIKLASDDSVTELTTLINSGDIIVNDGTSDLSASDGIDYIKYPNFAKNIRFTSVTGKLLEKNIQDALDESAENADTALNTPRFTIPLIYNGTPGNNEFIGYSNLIPGDDTPIVVPIDSVLQEYTFSNKNSNADYTIELRRNSTTAAVFDTTSKVNTLSFVQSGITQAFTAGDTIYIKYIDDGSNASDMVIVLLFKATA